MEISHQKIKELFDSNHYHMIDIGAKRSTSRYAVARGVIEVGEETFQLLKDNRLPKGNAIALAEVAGIQSAKQAFQHIPLCHPMLIDSIALQCKPLDEAKAYEVYCYASTNAKTGIEMEVLAGVNGALLTIYDLCKMVEPSLLIKDIQLLIKSGGKKGTWINPAAPESIIQPLLMNDSHPLKRYKAHILVASDRASQGDYEDRSGPLIRDTLEEFGMEVGAPRVIADEAPEVRATIEALLQERPHLIITSGGTGLSKRDVTVSTLRSLCERDIQGIAHLLRQESIEYTRLACLSEMFVGTIDNTLIVAIPGSPKAAKECLSILLDRILVHGLEIMNGEQNDHIHAS